MRCKPFRSVVCLSVGLAALPVTAGACSDDPLSEERDRLDAARARWTGASLSSYGFRYQEICFCPSIEPMDVQVQGGEVVAVFHVGSGEPVPPDQLSWYATVDGLFDRLETSLSAKPVQFEVVYDAALGYPGSASVDISEQIADEEYSFTVTDLAAVDD
jgi:hypothetical protein